MSHPSQGPGRQRRDATTGHPRRLRQWCNDHTRESAQSLQASFVVDARQADFVELISGDAVSWI